jgi:hypothetical protein
MMPCRSRGEHLPREQFGGLCSGRKDAFRGVRALPSLFQSSGSLPAREGYEGRCVWYPKLVGAEELRLAAQHQLSCKYQNPDDDAQQPDNMLRSRGN